MGEWSPAGLRDDLSPHCAEGNHDWCNQPDCCCACHIPDYPHDDGDHDDSLIIGEWPADD